MFQYFLDFLLFFFFFWFASFRCNVLILEATYGRNCYSQFLFTRHHYYYSAISAINTMDMTSIDAINTLRLLYWEIHM